MIVRKYISMLFIAVYAIIITHDLIPHFQQSVSCHVNDQQVDDSHPSHECPFPFHQHSMGDAGVFFNNSNFELSFNILNFTSPNLFDYADLMLFPYEKNIVHLIPPIYKGPELSSVSFRGPPVS